MNIKKNFFLVIASFLLIKGVSAYASWLGPFDYNSPIDFLLNDPWMQYMLLFLVFFGVLFLATKNAFKGDRGIAVGLSFAIAMIVTLALAQRGYLYDYLNGAIGAIAVFFAILLVVAFLIKLVYSNLGKGWTIFVLVILYPVIVMVDLSYWLPAGGLLDYAQIFQSFFRSLFGILVYLIILIVIGSQSSGVDKFVTKFFRKNG